MGLRGRIALLAVLVCQTRCFHAGTTVTYTIIDTLGHVGSLQARSHVLIRVNLCTVNHQKIAVAKMRNYES